jgi:hypothetical protein
MEDGENISLMDNNEHLEEICYQLPVILRKKITNIKYMWAKYNCITVGINVS